MSFFRSENTKQNNKILNNETLFFCCDIDDPKNLPKIMKRGSLTFWGDCFGRPMDNIHTVTDCAFSENVLSLLFDGGETCLIHAPKNIFSSDIRFYVSDAEKIEWRWYYYGREKTTENLYSITYTKISESTVQKVVDEKYKVLYQDKDALIAVKNNFAMEIC